MHIHTLHALNRAN